MLRSRLVTLLRRTCIARTVLTAVRVLSAANHATHDGVTINDVTSGILLGLCSQRKSYAHLTQVVVLSDGDNEPAAKQARLQSISLTDDLPQEVSTALLRLISRHPGLERVTISRSRKGIYSIYVSHAAGTKPLTRPSRKAEGIHAIISNWLDQFVTTAPAASEPTVVTLEPLSSATSTSAGLWVASMCNWFVHSTTNTLTDTA